jgi:hypothetical protein
MEPVAAEVPPAENETVPKELKKKKDLQKFLTGFDH